MTTTTASLPSTVSEFVVFPIVYGKGVHHILYAKAHSRGSGKLGSASYYGDVLPTDRTLFLVNVPPDATEREITLFFKMSGIVERVVFDRTAVEEEEWNPDMEGDSGEDEQGVEAGDALEAAVAMKDMPSNGQSTKRRKKVKKRDKDKPPSVVPLLASGIIRTLQPTGRNAYVIFLDAASVASALALSVTGSCKPRAWPREQEVPVGFARYRALHDALRPPLDRVLAHAESAIALYDYQEARRKQQSKYRKGEAIMDGDGFTLVTRGGAYGQTLGGGIGVASKRFQDTGETSKNQKKKGKKEMQSFYAFQMHERKRQELMDLKKRWAEDLEKVKKLKDRKRFKPY